MTADHETYVAAIEAERRRNRAFPRRMFVNEYGKVHEGWQIAGVFAAIVAAIVVVIGVIVGIAMWFDSIGCHSRWRLAGYEASYGPFQGCVVRTPAGWVPERAFGQVKVVD